MNDLREGRKKFLEFLQRPFVTTESVGTQLTAFGELGSMEEVVLYGVLELPTIRELDLFSEDLVIELLLSTECYRLVLRNLSMSLRHRVGGVY